MEPEGRQRRRYEVKTRSVRRADARLDPDRLPYVDLRKQWDKLIGIASKMLGYALVNEKADFFTFRHTGASNIAQTARNRDELMRVVNMMGTRTSRPSAVTT